KKYLTDIPTLDDIVVGNDKGLTSNLNDALSSCEKISFMAIENEGLTERINGTYHYVLRLYETPDECEEK
ncbi:10051_t:CDS:2, partial [Funneliformis geosporum]